MKAIIRFFFSAIFVIIPNVAIFSFIDPYETPKRSSFILFVLILLTIWTLTLKSKPTVLNLSRIDLAILLFLFFYILSTIFSIDILASLSSLIFILSCGLFYFFVKYIYKAKIIPFSQVIWSIIAGGIVSWFYYFHAVGALKILFANPAYLLFQNPPLGIPSNQSHQIIFAFYLLGIFWLSLLQGLYTFRKWQGKILLIISFLLLWVILLTGVRGAVLVLVAEALILLFFFARKIYHKSNLPIAIGTILIIALTSSFAYFKTNLWQRFLLLSIEPPSVNSLNIRLAENMGAIKIFLGRPILGYGPNTIQFTYPKYKPVFINQNEQEWQINISNIRNQYLNILASSGLLGIGSLLAIIYFASQAILKAQSNYKVVILSSLWLCTLLISFLYYQTVALSVLFWGCLGLLSSLCEDKSTISFYLPTGLFRPSAFLIGLTGITLALTTNLSNYYFSQALISTDKTNYFLDQSIKFNPFNISALITKGKISLELLKNKNTTLQEESEDALKKALFLSPHNIEAKRTLALLYFYQAQLNPVQKQVLMDAIHLANQVISADPYQPLNYDVLGQLLLYKGELKHAEENFRQAIMLKDNYLPFKYHLAETLKQQGRFKEYQNIEDDISRIRKLAK